MQWTAVKMREHQAGTQKPAHTNRHTHTHTHATHNCYSYSLCIDLTFLLQHILDFLPKVLHCSNTIIFLRSDHITEYVESVQGSILSHMVKQVPSSLFYTETLNFRFNTLMDHMFLTQFSINLLHCHSLKKMCLTFPENPPV